MSDVNNNSMIRIMIVDDHPLIREGLKTLLNAEKDMRVVAEAGSAGEAIDVLLRMDADVVILDISMPGKSGLDAIKEFRRHSKAAILFLTIHPEKRYALRAFKAGASGYLTKESAPKELINAIRKVMRGEKYASERFSNELVFNLTELDKPVGHLALSDREFEVFLKLAAGKDVHEIAHELSLSEATVYSHRERILEKMNMNSLQELTRYAMEQGLLS